MEELPDFNETEWGLLSHWQSSRVLSQEILITGHSGAAQPSLR
jgi:hypothetical protein